MINLTAYYYMNPQQTIQKGSDRCVSPLLASYVAFDIVKVNPFNQMIGKDAVLASMFFNNRGDLTTTTAATSVNTSKVPRADRHSMLTLENIKMHDRQIVETNNKFFPRINKLVEVANKRYAKVAELNRGKLGSSTNFTNTFSVFDALYELESFN